MDEPRETVPFRELEADALAAMTPAERAEFDAAEIETAARLRVAEMVYTARTAAGMTQTQLARAAGTAQSTVSAIENGAQLPGVLLLGRLARALGGTLHIDIQTAA
ncbi:MAG: helix-turn-helix domain-containing protein [Micrococcales bacterium]|nr:helix-turn-helix domain-containing protein [Micrococcales bacterium]